MTPRLPIVVAYALVPIPVAGWIVAQSLTERVAEFSGSTSAWVQTLAASTFAVILFASALLHGIIVTRRAHDHPRSYRLSRYVAWQLAVIVLSLAWVGCLIIGEPAYAAYPYLGLAIAATSIVTFVFVVKRDTESTQAHGDRVAAIRASRTSEAARRIRLARVLVPSGLVALVVVGTVLAAVLPFHYSDCEIDGTGDFNGVQSIYTTNCGDFTLADDLSLNDIDFGIVDITSRGFALLPLEPLAIEVTPSS